MSAKITIGALGFSAIGPVAGQFNSMSHPVSSSNTVLASWAAGAQAAIGNVAAGSAFAHVQSFAMGGSASALGGPVVIGILAAIEFIALVYWAYRRGLFGRLWRGMQSFAGRIVTFFRGPRGGCGPVKA